MLQVDLGNFTAMYKIKMDIYFEIFLKITF